MDEPPAYAGPNTPDHSAWGITGDIIFRQFQREQPTRAKSELFESLWSQLLAEGPLAAADVLYMLAHATPVSYSEHAHACDLVANFPRQVRPLLEHSLKNAASLTSVFGWGGSRNQSVFRFVVMSLGRVGNEDSIQLLRELSDDPQMGSLAVAAIKSIRHVSGHTRMS
jgi:hypothetical protein